MLTASERIRSARQADAIDDETREEIRDEWFRVSVNDPSMALGNVAREVAARLDLTSDEVWAAL